MTGDPSMLERVAKTIYEKRNGAGCTPWSRLPKSHQEPYRGDALAALSAIREPDERMQNAGVDKMSEDYDYTDEGILKAIYQAMIDAAIPSRSTGEA